MKVRYFIMNPKAKKASEVLTREEQLEVITKNTLQNLKEAPEATLRMWQESQAEKSDADAVLGVEAFLIGEYVGVMAKDENKPKLKGAKGTKEAILKRLEEVGSLEALKLILDFIDIADKGIISRKCKKAGDPFYSREYNLLNLYVSALSVQYESTLYQAERFIKNYES